MSSKQRLCCRRLTSLGVLVAGLLLGGPVVAADYEIPNGNLPNSWDCSKKGLTVTCGKTVILKDGDSVEISKKGKDKGETVEWILEDGLQMKRSSEVNSDNKPLTITLDDDATLEGDAALVGDVETTPDSEGDVSVGPGGELIGDVKTDRNLRIGEGATVDGDASVGRNAELDPEAELLGEVEVRGDFGGDGDGDLDVGEDAEVDGPVRAARNVVVRDAGLIADEVDAGRNLRLDGDGATIEGDATAGQDMVTETDRDDRPVIDGTLRTGRDVDLKDGGIIRGSIAADGDVITRAESLVEGNILSEGDVDLNDDSTVGEDVVAVPNDLVAKPGTVVRGCGIAGIVDEKDGADIEGGIIETDEDQELTLGDLESEGELPGLAAQSTRVTGDTLIFQGQYDASVWAGQLRAIPVDPDDLDPDTQNLEWQASNQLPAANSRAIFTHGANGGARFEWADLDDEQKAELQAGGNTKAGKELLAYVRGDRSNEGTGDDDFRPRDEDSLLGPVINSTPAASAGIDLDFERLDGIDDSYVDWVDDRPDLVYVGANDGMLHAFDGEDGSEVFAFVPDEVFGKFPKFAAQTDFRRYFVDASPRIGHAHDGDDWRSVLIGSTGAGGKAVFALDITDPENFGPGDVLWEFTHADLGHSVGQPSFARLDGHWVALFGNGYDSETAQLFVVDLWSGDLLARIDTEQGSSSDPNGLIGVTAFDSDGDRVTEAVYAGDLHGNLWKFDLDDDNEDNWGLADNSGDPLFSAGFTDDDGEEQTQPITAQPTVGPGAGGSGFMVYFGTGERGRVLADERPLDLVEPEKDIQSFYAVQDGGSTGLERIDLQEQEIETEFTGGSGADFRVLSDNEVQYGGGDSGWYIDLVSPGEEPAAEVVTEPAQLERGVARPRVIFNTFLTDDAECGIGSDGWLMEADALTGGRLEEPLFDVNDDGEIDSDDAYTGDSENAEPKQATGMRMEAVVTAPLIMGDGSSTESKFMGDAMGACARSRNPPSPTAARAGSSCADRPRRGVRGTAVRPPMPAGAACTGTPSRQHLHGPASVQE